MSHFKNRTSQNQNIEIHVEYDDDGNPTRTKIHLIKPSEYLKFDEGEENTSEIIQECIDNNLTTE